MSNNYPNRDNWDTDPVEDGYEDEEAIYPSIQDEETEAEADWDNDYTDDDGYDNDEDYIDDDIDASLYEQPVPPATDFDLEQEEPELTSSAWFQENWWRLAIVILLVLLIIAMLAKACTSKDKKTPASPPIVPTKVILPTLTPTMAAEATATPVDSGSQAPADAPTAIPPTPVPQPTTAVAPAPASTGKFDINQTVIVTDAGRDKLSFRAGPGTKYERLRLLKDGTQLIVIGGPKKGNGYTWWQLKTPKGEVGWAIEDNLR